MVQTRQLLNMVNLFRDKEADLSQEKCGPFEI
jgi:hypothetical protein